MTDTRLLRDRAATFSGLTAIANPLELEQLKAMVLNACDVIDNALRRVDEIRRGALPADELPPVPSPGQLNARKG